MGTIKQHLQQRLQIFLAQTKQRNSKRRKQMTKNSMAGIRHKRSSKSRAFSFPLMPLTKLLLGLLVSMTFLGCKTQTPQYNRLAEQTSTPSETIVLREGDILKISFPSAPNLNAASQPIRRDGKINLQVVGEVNAAGLTPAQLKQELVKLYSSELVSKEINVDVESSSFPVFVTGAVIKPGKISSNRPLTALEAIMEAGGFDFTKANLKEVKVIRHEGSQIRNYTLNLKHVMEGKRIEPFYLKPSDILYVPERFVWF
jgi:polysaccharide export outer membrane protein